MFTCATAVVILIPPAAPRTMRASPFSSRIIVGHIEERGRFPGLTKLALDGSNPFKFPVLGKEKSSIKSFRMMPVEDERNPLPNLKQTTANDCYI